MVLSNRPYDGQWTIAHVAADLSESRPDVALMGSLAGRDALRRRARRAEAEAAGGAPIRAVNLAITGANADTGASSSRT
jgi:hypothetical protein